MWIESDDLELLNSIFETEELIPRNRKGGLKLRHISFFNTGSKAITNVCKNLEKLAMQETIAHQYLEVLRKMGLVNKNEQITKYGKMLLKILYHNNNRIIDELNQPNVSVENISEDIPYIIEFFLFAVVKCCLEDREKCEKNGIDYSDLAAEPVDSLHYFFTNVIDTLKEPTNKNTNLNDLFAFDNSDFYYTLQGMNFSGFEVKRLFRLEPDKMSRAWKTYLRVLNEAKTVDVSTLTKNEKRYYEYASYYNNLVQKDVRNRVKHSILNYILLDSLETHRNHTKMVRRKEYDAILPYSFIEEAFEKYNLREVYNLVFFERDSQYITNHVKPLVVNDTIVYDVQNNKSFLIEETKLRQQHVNIGDDVMFSDESFTRIMKYYVYRITSMKKNGINITVNVEKKEEMNPEMEQNILKKFRED